MAKKPMRSIWVVCITAFTTVFISGGSLGIYSYLQDNFSKKQDANPEEEINTEIKEEKIEGKNLVILTSDREKLFLNFTNLETKKTVKKEVELGTVMRGGKWSNINKNPLVYADSDGEKFIFLERKEPSLSDKTSYLKIVETNKYGKEKKVLLESDNYNLFDNFLLNNNKAYYLKANIDNSLEEQEIKVQDLAAFDLENKKEEILTNNIGDFFQKELYFQNNKIASFYKKGSNIYLSSFDLDTKKLEKKYLFSYRKTRDYDLELEDIFISPSLTQVVYKDFSVRDGYSLKHYNIEKRKTTSLIKDKNYSFDNVFWVTDEEIVLLKTPTFSSTEKEKASYEIGKILISSPKDIEILYSTEKILAPVFADYRSSIFMEDKKIIVRDKNENKDFEIEGLNQPSDILFVGIFDY